MFEGQNYYEDGMSNWLSKNANKSLNTFLIDIEIKYVNIMFGLR